LAAKKENLKALLKQVPSSAYTSPCQVKHPTKTIHPTTQQFRPLGLQAHLDGLSVPCAPNQLSPKWIHVA